MGYGYKAHYGYYIDPNGQAQGQVTNLDGLNINGQDFYLTDRNSYYFIPEATARVTPLINTYNSNRTTMGNRFRNTMPDWKYFTLFPAQPAVASMSDQDYFQYAYWSMAQLPLVANYDPFTIEQQKKKGNPWRFCPKLCASMYARLNGKLACTFVYLYNQHKLMDQNGQIYTVGSNGLITKVTSVIGMSYNGSYMTFSGFTSGSVYASAYILYRYINNGSPTIHQAEISLHGGGTYDWIVWDDDNDTQTYALADSFWGFSSGGYDYKFAIGEDPDPYNGGGKSDEGGGGGTGVIPAPVPTPIPGVSDLLDMTDAFVNVYLPTQVQLRALSQEMWSTNFFNSILKTITQPMDTIISVHALPFTVTESGGTASPIQMGNYTASVSAKLPASQYEVVDCGSVTIDEIWGGYLDYKCRISIYLPFIGSIPLKADDVIGRTISVKYIFDIITGSCVAYVINDEDVCIATFGGNCAFPVPATGANHSQLVTGLAGLAASAVTGIAMGGMTAPVAAGLASSALNVATSKTEYQRAGGFGASTAYMGIRTPYMTVYVPNQCAPDEQSAYTGYPSYITGTLGEVRGYTEIYKVHLTMPGATETEISEVEGFLESGVIIKDVSAPSVSGNNILVAYQTSDERNVIGKSLTNKGTYTGSLRNESNIHSPSIIVEADLADLTGCNYFSIYGHFYWVTDIRSIRSGICEISGTVDALETYRAGIGSSSCIYKRQQNKWNLYIDDGAFITYANDKMYTVNFNAITGNSIVLITQGA